MKYIPPQLNELLLNHQELDEACTTETPENRKLAALIKAVQAKLQSDGTSQDEMRDYLLGARLFILETINSGFYLHSPELQVGRIYTSGSPLYSHLNRVLTSITAREKLIYINKFQQFIAKNQAALDQAQNIKSEALLTDINHVLTNQLTALTNPIANIVNAVPTESSLTRHMEKLPQSYVEEKSFANSKAWLFTSALNPKRILLAQLSQAISTIKCDDEENLPSGCFTRSQRIKLGLLLYIEKKIANEWKYTLPHLHSPKNSALYRICRMILNIRKEYNLDDTQQLACLDAFNSYINNSEARSAIEEFGRTHYGQENQEKNLLTDLDTHLDKISKFILSIRCKLEWSIGKQWPATVTCATVGAILGAAPGYAVGGLYGLGISESTGMRPVSNVVGNGITAYFGHSTSMGRFAYTVSDVLIASTITRAFAKLFELAGMAAGGVAGGAVGFTIDLTYKGLREVCINYLDFYDHHPDQMRTADPELVACLLTLPPEIFTPDKQNQIRYTADQVEEPRARVVV